MKSQTRSVFLACTIALCLCAGRLLAQDDNGGPGGPPPDGGPGNGGPPFGQNGPGPNFDPAQFELRMLDQARQNLSVTNDDEWAAIQPLVQKVMQARRELGGMGGMGMGMFMGMGPRPGGPAPGGSRGVAAASNTQDASARPRAFGPPGNEEQQALRKALTEKATLPEVKDALAKYRAARKQKQSNLETAQANLKGVLTARQEAQAVLMGLLP